MSEAANRAALIAEAREYADATQGGENENWMRLVACVDNLATALADAEIELAVARAIVNESIRGDRVIHQKLDDAERKLAAAKFVALNAVDTLARIASLDISATASIEDLVAPWRRLRA